MFKIKIKDMATGEFICTEDSSVVPNVGDIVLLESNQKFEVKERCISYKLSVILIYGLIIK